MSDKTEIAWCDSTFNGWEGCQKVGPGCDHCYAETRNARFSGGTAINWGPGAARRRTSADNWRKPVKWNRDHAKFFGEHGRCQRVFCSSLSDVFDNEVPVAWRVDLLDLIRRTPRLDWLLLTKRIGNVRKLLEDVGDYAFNHHHDDLHQWLREWLDGSPPVNVWLGATIVNREEMLRDAHKLKNVPARIRFWSVEPMLGDFGKIPLHLMPNWVICGGESGHGARPMHPDWARSLRDQCNSAGVPYLFKQWGEWLPVNISELEGNSCTVDYDGPRRSLGNRLMPMSMGDQQFLATGKKVAGRHLDGRTHDEFPA